MAVAFVAGAYYRADAVALAVNHARPADPAVFPRLHNVVEGLCAAAGLPKPRLYTIDDAALNAFATGRDPKHASVAVTTGLLERLDRVELEGVLAHELSHIKSYDTLVSTLAVTLVGVVALPQLVGPLMGLVVRSEREALADVAGVALTRYPPGLVSALEKLRADSTAVRSGARATAHLWIESPVARSGSASQARLDRLDTHPPLEERIEALREL